MTHRILIPAAALLLLSACSTYRPGFQYSPAPAVAVTESKARVLAAVEGVRRASAADGLPESVDVRLRIEAPPDRDVTLQKEHLNAVSADLIDLPLVGFGPDGDTTVPAGTSRQFTAYFGLPEDVDVDLDGLAVRWRALVGNKTADGHVNFERVRYAYHDAYPHYGHWSFGFGHYGGHHGYGFGFGHHW